MNPDRFWDTLLGFAFLGAAASLGLIVYAGYRFTKEFYESL